MTTAANGDRDSAPIPEQEDAAGLLGAMYVMEVSRFGGQLLAHDVEHALAA